jgi:hypothetical protein
VTRHRSKRAPWAATVVEVAIKPTMRTAAAAARTQQQEEVAAVVAQAPATHDPHQGRGQARAESHSA